MTHQELRDQVHTLIDNFNGTVDDYITEILKARPDTEDPEAIYRAILMQGSYLSTINHPLSHENAIDYFLCL